ncbi:MAG: hypothetical protein WC101_00475 [Candidatus Gracilibacteria bacterium]
MRNNSNFFVAFSGRKSDLPKKKRLSSKLSVWNLEKFSEKELIEEWQKKIPLLPHLAPKDRYQFETSKKNVKPMWGILVEDSFWKNEIMSDSNFIAICNLFSDSILDPLFVINELGLESYIDLPYRQLYKYWEQNKAKEFGSSQFEQFYSMMKSESEYFIWSTDVIEKWIKEANAYKKQENWRSFIAYDLFHDLKKYDLGKSPYRYPQEILDVTILLELLLTDPNEDSQISRKLSQRSKVLLNKYFPNIDQYITEKYNMRSNFAHGSHFITFVAKSELDENGNYRIPSIDFEDMLQYRKIIRYALITHLYLSKKIKAGDLSIAGKTVTEILKKAVNNPKLRPALENEVDEILSVMLI